jgi:hypothetical protein
MMDYFNLPKWIRKYKVQLGTNEPVDRKRLITVRPCFYLRLASTSCVLLCVILIKKKGTILPVGLTLALTKWWFIPRSMSRYIMNKRNCYIILHALRRGYRHYSCMLLGNNLYFFLLRRLLVMCCLIKYLSAFRSPPLDIGWWKNL